MVVLFNRRDRWLHDIRDRSRGRRWSCFARASAMICSLRRSDHTVRYSITRGLAEAARPCPAFAAVMDVLDDLPTPVDKRSCPSRGPMRAVGRGLSRPLPDSTAGIATWLEHTCVRSPRKPDTETVTCSIRPRP